jgi:prophage maintenance system killer protein
MKFAADSPLFGNEKDGSFKSALGAVYQSFGGQDLYPSSQEKAANLLYLVTKNHGFSDGNKRIAAGLFLYFLKRNKLLLRKDGSKRIADHTLVALTVMIACSKPEEKELMVNLVMTFLK